MKTELTDIISDGFGLDDCINHEALIQYTSRHLLTDISRIEWQNTTELYILGADSTAIRFGGLDAGCYTNKTTSWVLVIGAGNTQIDTIINRCGARLKLLDMRFLSLEKLSLHERLSNLESLRLSPMSDLKEVEGLSAIKKLVALDLSFTAIGTRFDVTGLPNLRQLELAGNPDLNNVDGLSQLNLLEELDLSGTAVGTSLDLSGQQMLKRLRLVDTPKLERIFGLGNSPALKYVDLSCSGIKRIPDDVRKLKNLNHLDLSNLNLEELPDWLPDLGMSFTYCEDGINLRRTRVHGINNMDLFSRRTTEENFQAHQMRIRHWFEEQKKEIARPLNELRVIFLGDGGVGKSHIITRLLRDGEQTNDFSGTATPGIVISTKEYQIGDRNVLTHFWDFGGQEILHSLHRLFMTRQALYVVVLSARDGSQDDRARYWLHNIKSFAEGAPVLLVLNQMDMRPNASVNEAELRKMYPALTEIVKVSTLSDHRENFEKNMLAALKRQIGACESLNSLFPPAWRRLMDRLQNTAETHLRGDTYRTLCDSCGVAADDVIRTDLLHWFHDLGIAFSFSSGTNPDDYVVLRPDWVTNAIYLLLFNRPAMVGRGLISHTEIYRLLQSASTDAVKHIDAHGAYTAKEVTYILSIMRKFQLSFAVDENTEYIPMLCDQDAPTVAAEYIQDSEAVEFRMVYEYLPNNVIHRLMIDRREDLDTANVWLTGARFIHGSTGLSALVMIEGNLLRIIVRSESPMAIAQTYMDTLMTDVEQISKTMGLTVAKKEIAYKANGMVEYFDYDDLLLALELKETHVRSMVHRTKIPIAAILMPVSSQEEDRQKKLIQDLIWSCTMLQSNVVFSDSSEDDRTTYIRDLLRAKGYFVSDHTLTGTSVSGKRMGEVDLDIRMEPNIPWTICEAMNLGGRGGNQKKYWELQLEKLLNNHNPNGLPFVFLVAYVTCTKDRFGYINQMYHEHMRVFNPQGYSVLSVDQLRTSSSEYGENHFLRLYRTLYDHGGSLSTVYHIFVHLNAR